MHNDALDLRGSYNMKMFFDVIKEIFELLHLVEAPAAYIMIFTPAWLLVLICFAIFIKKNRKPVFKVLAFIPLINFAIFYLLNFTRGAQLYGFLRYGPHLAAAVIYLIAGLIISKGRHKVLPLIISGFLALIISGWTVIYILAFGNAYHFGNLTHPGYKKSMEGLISELEHNYVLRDYKEIDFDHLRAEYIPLAEEAEKNKDEALFAEAVANLCYEFHDGHVSFNITDEALSTKVREKMAGNDYGFSMIRKDDGKTVVILSDAESEAYKLGIRDGVVITSWDGVDIDEAISKVRCVQSVAYMCPYPVLETEEAVKPIYLAGKGGDQIKVKFIDETGTEKEVAVSKTGSYFDRLSRALYPLTGKRCYEFGYAEMLDEHCGYLCIPRESYSAVNDVTAALQDEYPEIRQLLIDRIEGLKSQGMDRLIIDLRDNDGGIDVITEEVVSLFTKNEMVSYGGYYDGKTYRKSESWSWTIPADGRYSDIPVVALVNAGCASNGDVLAYRLSQCPNVTLLGFTTTWGSAQSLGGFCLLSGGKISVRYPLIATLDSDSNIMIDSGKDRKAVITLDERIPLDDRAVYCVYTLGGDYDLAYARYYINGELKKED